MVSPVTHRNDLEPLLHWPAAIAVGPGLGENPWGEQMLHAALAAEKPLVLDADALNLLAARGVGRLPEDCVITPHPGEAARLLNTTSSEVEADRFAAAQALAEQTGAVVVLKGPGTLIADSAGIALCDAGNPGMASGGMGDVLTGVIAALLAQGLSPREAARRGTFLHSHAADKAAQSRGLSALLATDVIDAIGEVLP
jgi:NAD(P)H-hydrate epimerase